MIILDTNVISEVLKPLPSARVMNWLGAQDRSAVYLTAITQAELFYGIEVLRPGKRRTRLQQAVDKILAEEFRGRVLPFDEMAAREFASIVALRNSSGRPVSQFDAMIAAIARTNQAAVATRNIADFDYPGLHVIDPWSA